MNVTDTSTLSPFQKFILAVELQGRLRDYDETIDALTAEKERAFIADVARHVREGCGILVVEASDGDE